MKKLARSIIRDSGLEEIITGGSDAMFSLFLGYVLHLHSASALYMHIVFGLLLLLDSNGESTK